MAKRERYPLTSKSLQLLAPPTNAWDSPIFIASLLRAPAKTLVRFLDFLFALLRSQPSPRRNPIRVVCISDSHTHKYDDIPDGDLLIHAGDLSNIGSTSEIQGQLHWLNSLPHRHKIVIAGRRPTLIKLRLRSLADQTGI